MKKLIGLTGPTGAGKSIASAVLRENGFFVIDCDKVSRSVTADGSQALGEIERAFSGTVKDGKLDRGKLAAEAFSSKEKTELLNSILFPYIIKEIHKQIKNAPQNTVVLDAPTLFESGLDIECSAVISVISDAKIRLERIMKRDGISEEAALTRMNAGKPNSFYAENSDIIIYNNGDEKTFLNDFIAEFEKLVKE